ncbi:hypothetical protein PV325_013137 [Microctonus aethiopoides]|nr:hypothetical protein PV325_013137 [Microctonus aethiopoides]
MTFTNKPMSGFAIQLNKNSFCLTPAAPLQVPAPLGPGASVEVSIISSTTGAVQRMDPIDNLQIAINNNIEDGQLDKMVFSSTCKEISAQNEVQYTLNDVMLTADQVV